MLGGCFGADCRPSAARVANEKADIRVLRPKCWDWQKRKREQRKAATRASGVTPAETRAAAVDDATATVLGDEEGPRLLRCSHCGQLGHNRRTCPVLKVRGMWRLPSGWTSHAAHGNRASVLVQPFRTSMAVMQVHIA